MVLGALVYRSVKKRRLALVASTPFRRALELIGLVVIAASVLLQNNLFDRLYFDPIPNLLVPLWAFGACFIAFFRKPLVPPLPNASGPDLQTRL